MNYLMFLLGLVIIIAVVSDLIYTTFSPDGAGFFTNIITKSVYGFFREVSVRTGYMKLFEMAGVLIIVMVLAFWYLSVWLGSALLLCSDPDSIVNAAGASAALIEKFYYAGFTISTLGIGDFTANSDIWRIFTVLLSFTGFVLITTGISYMLPVLSATVTKRRLGSFIATLGETPQDMLQNQWHDGNFENLESHFTDLSEMILQHSQQLLAYPVIHCFYSSDPRKSAALNIAKLDEALSILMTDIAPEFRPNRQSVYPLRKAITDYLKMQEEYFINSKSVDLSLPDLNQLKKNGIPLIHDQPNSRDKNKKFDDRRRVMSAILRDQGRNYNDVFELGTEYEL